MSVLPLDVVQHLPEGLGWLLSQQAAPPFLPANPPGREESAAADDESLIGDGAVGYGRDILVVDDNAANLLAIEAALEPLQRRLVLVRSGDQALGALLKQDFALILLDVQMPGLDGFETARLIQSRERYRSTPIIFVTGVEWPADTDLRGYELGGFDFLMKPIRPEVLRAKASVFIQLQERTFELQRQSQLLRLEQERAHERELQRASEVQFETMADTLPLLAWYANPDGSVPWYNHRWYEYIGVPAGQLGTWSREDILSPEDLSRVQAKWRAARETGTPWEDVFRIRRHDGELRWFLSRAMPLRDRSGTIVRWFGTNVDIDHQKLAEEAARRAEAAAAAANRAKDDFLAMLGHELRNPLAPILTALDVMRLRHPEQDEAERAIIERQVHHLTRLVDDLLDVSRISQGMIELKHAHFELASVVPQAIELVAPLLEKKQHTLQVEVPAQGLVIHGDPTRLAQVLANVLHNAAKYTDAGGVISLRADRDGAQVRISIRDNGAGISPEMLQRVFQMFTQEHQAMDRAQGGLGLGLAIASNIVALHGGTIAARSEGLGQGTELEIRMPASEQALTPIRQRATTASEPPKQTLRILVVDDNEDAAELLAGALGRAGHEVQYAFDGPSALALLPGFPPDIAILDLGLPVMNGYELAAQLQRALPTRAPKLIAVTGYGQAEDRQRTREAGFDLHLVKPINLKQIRAAIVEVTSGAAPASTPGAATAGSLTE